MDNPDQIPLIVSVLALLLGVIAIVLFFSDRTARDNRQMDSINHRFTQVETRVRELLQTSEATLNEARSLAQRPQSAPELTTYLAHQWDFIEKTFHNRFQKHQICRRIVNNHLGDHQILLLDSGSTVDLVTYEMRELGQNRLIVHTNNVFAAIHLVGHQGNPKLKILAGDFSHVFAASYSDEANASLHDLEATLYILAATAFSFEDGIMADATDHGNHDFKNAALRSFKRDASKRLIVAVDGEKFVRPRHGHSSVIPADEWQQLLHDRSTDIVIVTSQLPADANNTQRAGLEGELQKFRNAHVTVDQV